MQAKGRAGGVSPHQQLADGATYEPHLHRQSGGQHLGALACMISLLARQTSTGFVDAQLIDVMSQVGRSQVQHIHTSAQGMATQRG